jgi:hypothetical protein
VINRVNLGLEVNKKDEVLVDLIKYNRVDGISWLNQVPVECPKVVPPVDCLWSLCKRPSHQELAWVLKCIHRLLQSWCVCFIRRMLEQHLTLERATKTPSNPSRFLWSLL